jgi:hypothetical protein
MLSSVTALTAPTGQGAAVESRPSSGWQEPEGCCLACICEQLLVAGSDNLQIISNNLSTMAWSLRSHF